MLPFPSKGLWAFQPHWAAARIIQLSDVGPRCISWFGQASGVDLLLLDWVPCPMGESSA